MRILIQNFPINNEIKIKIPFNLFGTTDLDAIYVSIHYFR